MDIAFIWIEMSKVFLDFHGCSLTFHCFSFTFISLYLIFQSNWVLLSIDSWKSVMYGIWAKCASGGRGGGRKSYHTIFRFAFSLDKCARPFWWMRLSILANASVHFGEYCILCYIFTFVVMFLWFILCVLKTVLFTVVLNILMLMLIFFFSIALGSLPSPACITHERFHSLTTFLTATGLLLHHVGNVLGSILYEIVI